MVFVELLPYTDNGDKHLHTIYYLIFTASTCGSNPAIPLYRWGNWGSQRLKMSPRSQSY